MTHTTQPNRRIHEGRNVKRFREMLGIKQDALAADLGHDWNQQRVSLLEQKETIELDVLQRIATVLHLPVEAFQNFDEEQAISVISSTFNDNSAVVYNNPVFNPIEKIMELFERLLASEKEKTDLMKEILEKIK